VAEVLNPVVSATKSLRSQEGNYSKEFDNIIGRVLERLKVKSQKITLL